MAPKRSTYISLSIFGAAAALAIAYFIWLFLAPPPAVAPVGHVISTEIMTGVVASPSFQTLQSFANLPVAIGTPGRLDPFSNFAPAEATTTNTNTPTNTPIPPLGNSPNNLNLNGNSP